MPSTANEILVCSAELINQCIPPYSSLKKVREIQTLTLTPLTLPLLFQHTHQVVFYKTQALLHFGHLTNLDYTEAKFMTSEFCNRCLFPTRKHISLLY